MWRLDFQVVAEEAGAIVTPVLLALDHTPGCRVPAAVWNIALDIRRSGRPPIVRPLKILSPLILGTVRKIIGSVLEVERLESATPMDRDRMRQVCLDQLKTSRARLSYVSSRGLEELVSALEAVRQEGARALDRIDSVQTVRERVALEVWQDATPYLVAGRLSASTLDEIGLCPVTAQMPLAPLCLQEGDELRVLNARSSVALWLSVDGDTDLPVETVLRVAPDRTIMADPPPDAVQDPAGTVAPEATPPMDDPDAAREGDPRLHEFVAAAGDEDLAAAVATDDPDAARPADRDPMQQRNDVPDEAKD